MKRSDILHEMGFDPVWRLRKTDSHQTDSRQAAHGSIASTAKPVSTPVPPHEIKAEEPARQPTVSPDRNAEIAQMDWQQLEQAIAGCRACKLCEQRRQAVTGVGDKKPEWLFVGEGPGADEDAKGEPFVGQAGKLLDNQLAAIGLKRGEKVYIANVVKCRPPGNRTPDAEEIACCLPFLERQIELLQPQLIVALGATAVQGLMHEKRSIASLRGRRFEYRGIPLTVSYHPAYLLRNLPDKAKAWADLCFARHQLRTLIPADYPADQ